MWGINHYDKKKSFCLMDQYSACINSFLKFNQPAGHIVTGDLKIITDSRIRTIIYKGP